LGIVYLANRIGKFSFVKRLSGGRKLIKYIISYTILACAVVNVYLFVGMINTVIVIIHLMVFWIISDGLGKLIGKIVDKYGLFAKDDIQSADGVKCTDGAQNIDGMQNTNGAQSTDGAQNIDGMQNTNGAQSTDGMQCTTGMQYADSSDTDSNTTKRKIYYEGIIAIVFTGIYMTIGWALAHNVRATYYTVSSDKCKGNIRIVQIADSHIGSTFSGKEFNKHIEVIQSENPDVVLVTGDYVDDETSKQDMIDACKALGKLRTTYGVYYSFGNHDGGYYPKEYRGYDGEDMVRELENNNVTVLQDESVLIDDRFYIIGRKDRSFGRSKKGTKDATVRMTPKELTKELDKDKYMIVLDHQPSEYADLKAAGVNLVFSGHTHAGQLFPFNRMGQWLGIDEMSYGLRENDDTVYVVTSGISNWEIKFRTGCRAEYVVLDVVGK